MKSQKSHASIQFEFQFVEETVIDVNGSDDDFVSDLFHFDFDGYQQQVDACHSRNTYITDLVLVDFKFRWGRICGVAVVAYVRAKTRFVDFLGFKNMATGCGRSPVY
jgi:hypothetical protein